MLSFGKKYYIRDEHGNNLFFARMEKLKPKPKIFICSDDTRTSELLTIIPRNVFDAKATYDIVDARSKALVGSFKREGLMSFFLPNRWKILDTGGNLWRVPPGKPSSWEL